MSTQHMWTLNTLVEAYRRHQQQRRGLRDQTLDSCERLIRTFVRDVLGGDPIDLKRLAPSDVVQFVMSARGRFSPRSMRSVGTRLRSFFRYLRAEGLCDERLEAAIPVVADWRLLTLPRCLNDDELEQVLASLDLSKPCGFRDRAIVLCLSTLGLRPGELADLRLEDIDWRGGTVRIRTRKTRRGAVLPLPREAGRAVVAYLRGHRPPTEERRVFVQHIGLRRGKAMSRPALSVAAVRAIRRAGVEPPLAGAYVFRHTVASRMVGRGVSLKEVADFLGHKWLGSTMTYAKLDVPALREAALDRKSVV